MADAFTDPKIAGMGMLDLVAEVERVREQRDAMLREAVRSRNDVERLKASYGWLNERFPKIKAEVERLRERLRPFAEFLDALDVHGGWDPPDGWIVRIDTDPPVTLAYEELVRARQALLDDRTETSDG